MKDIAKFLPPLAVVFFLGTLLASYIGLLAVTIAPIGFVEGPPLSHFLKSNLAAISAALPMAGMAIFIATPLGPFVSAEAIGPARTEVARHGLVPEGAEKVSLSTAA